MQISADQSIKKAKNKYKKGLLKEAQDICHEIVNQYPRNQKALSLLKNINETVLTRTENLDPPTSLMHSCIELFNQRRFGEILKKTEDLGLRFPASAALKNLRGVTYHAMGNFEAAIEDLTWATRCKPNFVEGYYNLGNVLRDNNDLSKAQSAYERALKIQPNHTGALNNLGLLLEFMGRSKEAKKIFQQSLLKDPQNSLAKRNLGNVLFNGGFYHESMEHLKSLSDQESVSRSLECLYHTGRLEEFIHSLEEITAKDPYNLRVAAVSAFAANQLKIDDIYPFCPNPMDMIHKASLSKNLITNPVSVEELLVEMSYHKTTWEPIGKSTRGGSQTSVNLFNKPASTIKRLKAVIEEEIDSFRQVFRHSTSNLISSWPRHYELQGWFVRLGKGGFQESHIHREGWVSGVIYLKTIEQPSDHEGSIEFSLHGYKLPISDESYPRQIFEPEPGDIVIFPSSLFHQTIPIQKNTERCIIAFDLVPLDRENLVN